MSEEKRQAALAERAEQLASIQLELHEVLQERFLHNLEVFKRFYPELATRFSQYQPKRQLDFFCTENGQANLFWVKENEFFYKTETPCDYCAEQVTDQLAAHKLHRFKLAPSPDRIGQINHRYLGEMVNQLKKLEFISQSPKDLKSLPNCVMVGCGLGYQLGYLYAQAEVNNLILIEPDEDLFFASLHAFDWASLLPFLAENQFALHLIVGKGPAELFPILLECYAKSGRFLSGLRYLYVHYSSDKITQCLEVIEQNKTMYMAMLGFFDDQLFGVSHALQAVLSHKQFIRDDVELPAQIRALPWVVVGNGPSLDHDIPFLRKFQDKLLIVACGTALETLYHAGIQPDFYGCTERTPEIADTLKIIPDPSFFDKLILLSGEVVHPFVQQYFKHTAIFLKQEEAFYALYSQKMSGAGRLRTITMMNPMVGNLGAAAGTFLGFERIYLMGIDNGTKIGAERVHSQFNRLYAQCPKRDTTAFYKLSDLHPGNFGGNCVTNSLYLLSARTNEELAGYARYFHPSTKFYNCSDGLYMEGFTPLHSESLVTQFEPLPNIDKAAVHDFFTHRLTIQLKLTEQSIPDLLQTEAFQHCCDDLLAILSKPAQHRAEGVLLMQRASAYLYDLRQSGEQMLANYLEGSLQYMFIVMLTILYHSQELEKCLKPFNFCLSLVGHFLAEAKALYALQPNYILGPHQQLLKGKVGTDYADSKAPPCPRLMHLIGKNYKDEQLKFSKKYQ